MQKLKEAYEARRDKLALEDYIAKEEARVDRTITDGSVVFVEYENGHWFILNYNTFIVDVNIEVDGVEYNLSVAPMDFYDSKVGA